MNEHQKLEEKVDAYQRENNKKFQSIRETLARMMAMITDLQQQQRPQEAVDTHLSMGGRSNAEIDETNAVVLKGTIEPEEQNNRKTHIIAPELFDESPKKEELKVTTIESGKTQTRPADCIVNVFADVEYFDYGDECEGAFDALEELFVDAGCDSVVIEVVYGLDKKSTSVGEKNVFNFDPVGPPGHDWELESGVTYGDYLFEKSVIGVSISSSEAMATVQGKWIKLDQKGTGPGARSSHAITMAGQKAYALGDEYKPSVPVDSNLYVSDLNDLLWSVVSVTGDIPPPQVRVTMASIGDTIYVFGGRDSTHKELNELYSFNTCTSKWTFLFSGDTGAHSITSVVHSITSDDRNVYIFGGCSNKGWLNDLWAYDTVVEKWLKFPVPGENCKGRGGSGLAVAQGIG